MKILSTLINRLRGTHRAKHTVRKKTVEEYQQELLIRSGREQFRKLIDKGLQLPIAVL